MSNDFAYAMFRIQQRQARNLCEQHDLEELFLTFVSGGISADEYERKLQLKAAAPTASS